MTTPLNPSHKFLVKFFPEMMIKGEPVRKQMTRQLHENLLRLLRRIDRDVLTKKYRDKIEVFSSPGLVDQVQQCLISTPGIDQVWRVKQYPIEGMQDILELVVPYALPLIEGKTFVVRAKRVGQHDFSSMELERVLGQALCLSGQSLGVDLHYPQVKIELDVFHGVLNLIEHKLSGLGGYPLGTQDEVLSLMSGGFDSTVASYLSIKRGLKTHFVFFNLGGTAHELGVKQVAIYLWNRFESSHRVQFVSVPFDEVVAELIQSVHESYLGVMLKTVMLQAAEKLADQLGLSALVTGESVAQVSSQTLANLTLIDQACDKLVLRPLALMNKTDIVKISDQIGTRHFSEAMPEYCGVMSQNPVIKASATKMALQIDQFDPRVLQRAIARVRITPVDQLVTEIAQQQAEEVVHQILPSDLLVDIRAPQESAREPLEQALRIPFYKLNQAARHWDKHKRYLLYCQKGVMSQVHAQYLRDQGVNHVYVYRPNQDKTI